MFQKIVTNTRFCHRTSASLAHTGVDLVSVDEARQLAVRLMADLEAQIIRCLLACGNATITIENNAEPKIPDISMALEWIRIRYKKDGLNIREFAKLMDMSSAMVSRLLNRHTAPSAEIIERLVRVVDDMNTADPDAYEVWGDLHRETLLEYVAFKRR